MKIELSEAVKEYLGKLAPEPRRRLRHALRSLSTGRGDFKPLEDDLTGLYRLRVGRTRVLFRYERRYIYCVFAEDRSVVYQMYAAAIRVLRG